MIKTFADKHTQQFYLTGRSRRIAPDIIQRARRKLEYVDIATWLQDLRIPPGNRLHELGHDREGRHAIRINDQWRICFRFEDGDAYDVEITDYHFRGADNEYFKYKKTTDPARSSWRDATRGLHA